MSENYIVINGKKAELTEEQLKALGIEENPENPFAGRKKYVYTIVEPGGTDKVLNNPSLRENGLAFNDMEFAHQVALHQLFYRLLLKYAYDTNTIDRAEWNGNNRHYNIIRSNSGRYFARVWISEKDPNSVYFNSSEAVNDAIRNVIPHFVREHPEFVW